MTDDLALRSVRKHFWNGARVMITGVSGSLGSALSRELLKPEYGLERLAGISRKWQPLRELETSLNDKRFRPFIGDVRDEERLRLAFRGVDYIFHAAAIKDVLYCEYNPTESLATNCFGTKNVLHAALECGARRVVLVSTDKAASPINCYGASKRMAECMTVAYNAYGGSGGTRYSVARYGNVVGSSGSVIPLFFSQREKGKLTVTHPRATRFWIAMQQAVHFIMDCMIEMRGGEIFVPHLPAERVMNIASAIAPDAEIEIIGMRPWEKVHEIMLMPDEAPRTQDLGWAYRVEPNQRFWGGTDYPSGSPVPLDWVYSSASAPRLTSEEIKVITDGVE